MELEDNFQGEDRTSIVRKVSSFRRKHSSKNPTSKGFSHSQILNHFGFRNELFK